MADVEVKGSPIEGLGVYSAQPFGAGQRIRRVNIVREIAGRGASSRGHG